MTAYIANHEKKNRLFSKRERELMHAIKNGFAEKTLVIAAEKVRSAKMSVFKCQFAKSTVHQAHKFSPEEMATKNKRIQRWLAMSTTDIINEYRGRIT